MGRHAYDDEERDSAVPMRIGASFAFAGLLGVVAYVMFNPAPEADVNQALVRAELAAAHEQLSSLEVNLREKETETAAHVASNIETILINRAQKIGRADVVRGDESCPDISGENQTIADKYSDPWRGSFWRWAFVSLGVLALVLLYGQIIDVGDQMDGKTEKNFFFALLEKIVNSIRNADTFKQPCAYDPYKDDGQAPAGNAYRLLAVVGPNIFGIDCHNKDGTNPKKLDRTDSGFKCTLPNALGYFIMICMTLCILVMQAYIPYSLLTGVMGDSEFIGFKVMQYYLDFPARLGLELVPLTLMSMKFFVKVEKVVRDEFNQCLWLLRAAWGKQIQFQVLGRVWSCFWILVSFFANTYIAVCMTLYVVLAICVYQGGDIMSFFLKVLGSLGLISFDDDIMAALPQWSGWYAEHTNVAGHPLGGHPMGAPADFFAGPESVRAGGDRSAWGEPLMLQQPVTLSEGDFLAFIGDSAKFDKKTLSIQQAGKLGDDKTLFPGMKLISVQGSPVDSFDDIEGVLDGFDDNSSPEHATSKATTPDEYAKELGITWHGKNKRRVAEVSKDGTGHSLGIKKGAVLTHLHGHFIENDEHLDRVANKYKEMGQSGGAQSGLSLHFMNKKTETADITIAFSLSKRKIEQKDARALLQPAKGSRTKFVRLGIQFSEGREELGFRLTGTMVSAVMPGSAAFWAVDMAEVENGVDLDGEPDVPAWKGEGQPFEKARKPYLYKGRNFKMERVDLNDGKGDHPAGTGLEAGMFVTKVNGKPVNSFGDIMFQLRRLKGDDLNYSNMRYEGEEQKEEWAKEWTGQGLKTIKRHHDEITKEFTITCSRAGDEDSQFDDFVHGFIYMLIRILLMFSLLFILVSYWQKGCTHVGV